MTAALENERSLAQATIKLMEKNGVMPSPENYTVWYHYAQGKNTALIEEIDKFIAQKIPFTVGACATIHQRFFVVAREQGMVDSSAVAAQKMLKDVLKVVNDFSGETTSYNQDLGSYIENISQDASGADVQAVIKNLIGATMGLKERGEQMSKHLEESKKEIDKLRENLQEVTTVAQRDGLTGLYNRRTFEEIVGEYLTAVEEKKSDLCLIMLDVDHFKKFNDTYGHLLGDEVLKIVARTLTDSLKGRDVVARFGGEEFVVVLPDTPMEGGLRVADAIRQSIANKELKRKDTGQNFGQITVSLGVSRYRHGVDDIPKLIKRADEALYQSKKLGRNRVTRES